MKKWNKMKSNITDEELNYKFMNGYNKRSHFEDLTER